MPQNGEVAKKSTDLKFWQYFYWKHDKATLTETL